MADYFFNIPPPPNHHHRSQQSTTGDSKTHRDQWIWKPADMRSTPSRLVGIDWESENFLRGRAINWVIRISVSLQLPQLIIATASVYLHRFYMRKSVRRYSPKVMSATALFLATKVEEVPRKLEYIVREYLRIDENGDEIQPGNLTPEDSEESASFKQQILYFEGILLRTLCFDLAVDHPYTTLIQTVKNIHISHTRIRPIEKSLPIDMADRTKAKSLAQASWGFLNDSLMTPLCVIHRPEVIAAAAFLIAVVHRVIECSSDHQAASDPSLPLGLDESWLRSEVYRHLNLPDISNDPASEGSSKAQEWWTCFKVENLQSVYESANVILDQYLLSSSSFINQCALKIPRFPAPPLLPDSSDPIFLEQDSRQRLSESQDPLKSSVIESMTFETRPKDEEDLMITRENDGGTLKISGSQLKRKFKGSDEVNDDRSGEEVKIFNLEGKEVVVEHETDKDEVKEEDDRIKIEKDSDRIETEKDTSRIEFEASITDLDQDQPMNIDDESESEELSVREENKEGGSNPNGPGEVHLTAETENTGRSLNSFDDQGGAKDDGSGSLAEGDLKRGGGGDCLSVSGGSGGLTPMTQESEAKADTTTSSLSSIGSRSK